MRCLVSFDFLELSTNSQPKNQIPTQEIHAIQLAGAMSIYGLRGRWFTKSVLFGIMLLLLISECLFGPLQLQATLGRYYVDERSFSVRNKPAMTMKDDASGTFQTLVGPPMPRDWVLPYRKIRLSDKDRAILESTDRIIHVLTHTHWDREWYMSLEEFRGSLIIALDRIFDMLNDPKAQFNHFHMDGQYLMVEDYLEARPSMREMVANMNREGKITLGPFYSQPDVFLASGEALIRNLMLGMSLSSDMGGTSRVGYLPDTFGFIGQVPQLLRGVGIKTFVSGRFANKGSEGRWQSPDGSIVLYAFLANWYCHARKMLNAPTNITRAQSHLKTLKSSLTRAGAKSKHLLAMSGCDHHMTSPKAGINIEIFNEAAKLIFNETQSTGSPLQLVQTNIDDYMDLLGEDLVQKQANLPIVKGEVRERSVDSLINSASTKMSVKQKNFNIQALLEQWVEPLEAYGWALNGRRYDSDRIWHAWKPVLQTHAHDSICSTSASSVIHDIVNRLSRSEQSAYRLAADQAGQVIPAMITALERSAASTENLVLLMNPTNTPRSEVVIFTMLGSSPDIAGRYSKFRNLLVADSPVHPATLVTSTPVKESFYLPNAGFRKKIQRASATYMARVELPPNGIALLQLISDNQVSQQRASVVEIESTILSLENEHLRVVVNTLDGSCSVEHLASGKTWSNVNKLVHSIEHGTSYRHVGSRGEKGMSETSATSHQESAAFSSIELKGKLGASAVSITYVLFQGARRLEIETTIENADRDNYAVATFPARRNGANVNDSVEVAVDGVFEYVNRTSMYHEGRYVHQNRFTSMYSAGSSITVANRGIPEYIAAHGSLKVTLIRGVNKIGDWIVGPLKDDISQELRKMTFQYAVIPDVCQVTDPTCSADTEARNFVHPVGSFASWVGDAYRPERYIDMDASPLSVVSSLAGNGRTEKSASLEDKLTLAPLGSKQIFDLKPAKLILSTVKKAESKDALVVRLYNPTAFPLDASLAPGLIKFTSVKQVRLNENDLEAKEGDEFLTIHKGEGGDFSFTVGPFKILTLLLTK